MKHITVSTSHIANGNSKVIHQALAPKIPPIDFANQWVLELY